MNDQIIDVLAECLEAVEAGTLTPAECLARYPQYRQELAELLDFVVDVKTTAIAGPRPAFQRTARARLVNLLPNRPVTFGQRIRHIWQTPKTIFSRRFAMTWILIIAAAATLLTGGGVAYASTDALPGDGLYPVKETIEGARLALAGDEADFDLYLDFADERLEELEALAATGRYEDIPTALDGYEEAIDELGMVRTRLESGDPANEDALATRIHLRLETHAQLLDQLQTQLQTRDQLQLHIQDALNLATQAGNLGPGEDAGPPEEAGPPEDAGPDEDAGPPEEAPAPEDAGPDEEAGPPEEAGPSDDAGPDEDAGMPEGAGEGGPNDDAQQGPKDNAGNPDNGNSNGGGKGK